VKGATDFYPKLVDPDECLAQYLAWLAGIVGWELDTNIPTAQQRQEIMSAVPVYKVKGTSGSLERLIRAISGVENTIIDPMAHHILMSNRINRLSANGVDGLAYTSWIALTAVARGDIAIPTSLNSTGYYYQVISAGTTGGSEPTWPTTVGDDVTDGTVTWRCRQFSAPHLTADVSAGASSITVDSTAEFEAGKTINIRDDTTTAGEEIVISTIPDSTTLNFATNLVNSYTMADDAKVTPAFDWHDDETGFIWDIPLIDDFAGIDPSRVRIPGEILDPSELYSFEFIRIWFILQAGESVSVTELDRIARIMEQFAPADTEYVVRIEQQ
jgi:phage tail-like protein